MAGSGLPWSEYLPREWPLFLQPRLVLPPALVTEPGEPREHGRTRPPARGQEADGSGTGGRAETRGLSAGVKRDDQSQTAKR
mgnify:CR=1 FL=1